MEKRPVDQLLFVFSADSGAFNAFLDSAKKLLTLNGCALCSITHGLAGETGEWQQCKEELGVPIEYVHRDEVTPEMAAVAQERLPCILARSGGDLVFLIGPDVLDRCKGSVADLKGRLGIFAAMNGLELPQAA